MRENNQDKEYIGIEKSKAGKEIRHDGFTPPKTRNPPQKPRLPKKNTNQK